MSQHDAFDSPPGPAPERLRLASPAQILAAVPFLLGFQPERSGVVICISRRLVGLTMRFDLDLPQPAMHETIRTRLAAENADAVILVLVDPPAASRRGRCGGALADELHAMIRGTGVRVQESLGVREGRFWSYLCRDRRCCPPHGRPVPSPADSDYTRVAADFVAAGIAPLPTREALSASVEPGPGADAVRVRAALRAAAADPPELGVRRWRRAIDRHRLGPLRPGGGVSADEAAMLVAAVVATPVRDEVILWCADKTDRDAVIGVCQELAPLAPPPFHTQLLAILAWAAHAAGEGALAAVALERALQTDPEHSMSRLLLTGLYGGIRPEQMQALSCLAADSGALPDAC